MGWEPKVTPLAGVWVEITTGGLDVGAKIVTPLAGVWVEIRLEDDTSDDALGHSPCGSVG